LYITEIVPKAPAHQKPSVHQKTAGAPMQHLNLRTAPHRGKPYSLIRLEILVSSS
jgi:hypothetical protein